MDQSKIPSWVGSVALHAAVVLALIYLNFNFLEPPPPLAGVPVTLVSSGPPASVQPETTPAAEETAPPAPPQPLPTPPTPKPPAPTPAKEAPQPQPKPPTPAPTKAGKTKPTTPQKPQDSTPSNYDPLAAAKKAFGGSPAASAPKKLPPGPHAGPPKVGPVATAQGVRLEGLVNKMNRLWNIDCSIAGNRNAVIPIKVKFDENGNLVEAKIVGGGSELFAGAGPAAVRALKAGSPYSTDEVPPGARDQEFTMNFHAEAACIGK